MWTSSLTHSVVASGWDTPFFFSHLKLGYDPKTRTLTPNSIYCSSLSITQLLSLHKRYSLFGLGHLLAHPIPQPGSASRPSFGRYPLVRTLKLGQAYDQKNNPSDPRCLVQDLRLHHTLSLTPCRAVPHLRLLAVLFCIHSSPRMSWEVWTEIPVHLQRRVVQPQIGDQRHSDTRSRTSFIIKECAAILWC